MSSKKSKNIKEVLDKNPFEGPLTDLGSGIASSVHHDLVQEGRKDFFEQLLGLGDFESNRSFKLSGELIEGQEFDLKVYEEEGKKLRENQEAKHAGKEPEKAKKDIEPGINYFSEIIHGEKRISKEYEGTVESKIQEIIVELRRLISSSAQLQVEYKEIVMEQRAVKAGKYYVNFFEWLLTVIRSARMKVEDSGAWLSAMKGKKGQKGYWSQFKKHGTSFGLSNERVVATQTG